MRDLLVFTVIALWLPTAFRRPFIGLLMFSWLAYMRPQDLCWGFARDMRFSFIVGLVMLVGWFVHENGVRPFWRPDVRTKAMLALVVLTGIGLVFARQSYFHAEVLGGYLEFVKIMVVAAFTTGQVDSRQRLRILLWTIALCLGFYGFKNGVLGILRGGTTILRGPGGMLEDNNDFALALVMNIPMLWYLGRSENNAWVRRGTLVLAFLTAVTVLLTHSRGGFVAMAATVLLLAWRARRLMQAGFMLALVVSLFFLLTPQSVLDRIATIGQGTQEESAGARVKAWGTALRMIGDHPVLGVGLRNFRGHYPEYTEGFVVGEHVAFVSHNSYLQIWAEGGSIAFAVYLLMLGSVFVSTRWVRQVARRRPDLAWADTYARMMEATTVGFMVGATFLNRGHFDLIYHWLALLSALVFITRLEFLRGPATSEAPAAARITVRWRRAPPAGALRPRWGR